MADSVPVELRSHFDQIADAYYEIVDRVWYDVGYYHRREGEVLLQEIRRGSPIRTAFDVGCGPGRHTLSLAAVSSRVVAVDISRRMLEITRSRLSKERIRKVELVQADIRHLPFRAHVGDFVLNMELIEHLTDPRKEVALALAELHRILDNRGRLLTEAPLEKHVRWRQILRGWGTWKEISPEFRKRHYEATPLVAQHVYREAELVSLLRRAGFRGIRRRFIRVVPAGIVERYPLLEFVDRVLERILPVNRLAREVVLTAEKGPTRG